LTIRKGAFRRARAIEERMSARIVHDGVASLNTTDEAARPYLDVEPAPPDYLRFDVRYANERSTPSPSDERNLQVVYNSPVVYMFNHVEVLIHYW